jgi:hypothetical protein
VNAGATAQQAYRLMLREYIAPALRALGFQRGPSPGTFRYETGTHAAETRFIKSRGSTWPSSSGTRSWPEPGASSCASPQASRAFAVKTKTARVQNFYVPAGLDLQQSSTHGASATTILETITPHGRPTMLTGSGTTSPTPGP